VYEIKWSKPAFRMISALSCFFSFLWWDETESIWYVGRYLTYCTSPGLQIMINMEQSVECELTRETEVLGEKLPQYHFVHHKSHMTWPGPGPRNRRLTSCTTHGLKSTLTWESTFACSVCASKIYFYMREERGFKWNKKCVYHILIINFPKILRTSIFARKQYTMLVLI
jgi:hypothetical protein